MTSGNSSSNRVPQSPEPIPLRDLRPPDDGDGESPTSSPSSDAGRSTDWGHLGTEGSRRLAAPSVGSGSGAVASKMVVQGREAEGGGGGDGGFGAGYGGFGQRASLSPNTARSGGGLRPSGFGDIGRRLSTSLHLQSAQNPLSKANFESKLGGTDVWGEVRRASGYAPEVKVTTLDVNEDDQGLPPPTAFRDGLLDALGVSDGTLAASGARRGSWLPGAEVVAGRSRRGSWLPGGDVDDIPTWAVGPAYDSRPLSIAEANEEDDAPLTAASNMQPMAGSNLKTEGGPGSLYLSPQFSPAFSGPFGGGSPGGRIGDDLSNVEQGIGRSMSVSRRKSLSPATAGAFGRRLSTAVGMMSQRVVNLGNDPDAVENSLRRKSSTKGREVLPPPTSPFLTIPELPTDIPLEDVTLEKPDSPSRGLHLPRPEQIPHYTHRSHPEPLWRQEQTNPLKGDSLKIFGPNNWLRLRLCSVLVHPYVLSYFR